MIKFYLIIVIELLFSPFLYFFEETKKLIGKYKTTYGPYKLNTREIDNEVIFAVHEWAGYPFVREKTIKYVNNTFTCGFEFHYDRLMDYKGRYQIRKILTISECNDDYLKKLKGEFDLETFEIFGVSNKSMDFSGYAYVCEKLLNPEKEQIVFLTNTSVDSQSSAFLDDYVELFKRQPELGLIGTSYSTKIYQTVIKNNFRPHLQSFFLVTRSSILNKLLIANGGTFPGSTEDYKLAIIRFGEVKLTEMIQKLGFKVGVVTEDGELNIFPNSGRYYNGYTKWRLPMNDYRLSAMHPNKINVLK